MVDHRPESRPWTVVSRHDHRHALRYAQFAPEQIDALPHGAVLLGLLVPVDGCAVGHALRYSCSRPRPTRSVKRSRPVRRRSSTPSYAAEGRARRSSACGGRSPSARPTRTACSATSTRPPPPPPPPPAYSTPSQACFCGASTRSRTTSGRVSWILAWTPRRTSVSAQ